MATWRLPWRSLRVKKYKSRGDAATLPGLYISYTRQGAKIAFTILFLTFLAPSLGVTLREKKYKSPGNAAAPFASFVGFSSVCSPDEAQRNPGFQKSPHCAACSAICLT
jgi:hypothetical protein